MPEPTGSRPRIGATSCRAHDSGRVDDFRGSHGGGALSLKIAKTF